MRGCGIHEWAKYAERTTGGPYNGYVGGKCRSKISDGKYLSLVMWDMDECDIEALGRGEFAGRRISEAEVVPSSKISKLRGSPRSIGNSSLMIESFVRVR